MSPVQVQPGKSTQISFEPSYSSGICADEYHSVLGFSIQAPSMAAPISSEYTWDNETPYFLPAKVSSGSDGGVYFINDSDTPPASTQNDIYGTAAVFDHTSTK